MTGLDITIKEREDLTGRSWFQHSSAPRVNTDAVLIEALRLQYPKLDLVIAPRRGLNLMAYASAGHATATSLEDDINDPVYGVAVKWRLFIPPARRLDGGGGLMAEDIIFGKFMYKWRGHEFILYIADGRDGSASYPVIANHYILSNETHKVDELIKEATTWAKQLHNEVWVYDHGWWEKNRELYDSVAKSSWDNVILDEAMKATIIADVERFFDGRETYQNLKVPWKRGVIYYGPPGNGKTISIKAMMHALQQRGNQNGDTRMPVPTLYVRSLFNYGGPEAAIEDIFSKARAEAPCYLVFEDLDSLVTDAVRSYFLNELDGLKSNDGILIVGSTNHLDRLDPGIAKRPSRFDRKFFFPDPDWAQRVQYAQFWQRKLRDNKEIEFPDRLCERIADITDKFSFAYMQEAFVATLLSIAAREDAEEALRWSGPQDPMRYMDVKGDGGDDGEDPELGRLKLWREIKKQVKLLRDEMEEKQITEKMEGLMPLPPQIKAGGEIKVESALVREREREPVADELNEVFRVFK